MIWALGLIAVVQGIAIARLLRDMHYAKQVIGGMVNVVQQNSTNIQGIVTLTQGGDS